MIGEEITCENKGCEVVFVKKTHNQRYHDDECCRLATNAKIMEKYYKRRAQASGQVRQCESCATKLSRYNADDICGACTLSQETNRSNEVMSMLTNVAWQG